MNEPRKFKEGNGRKLLSKEKDDWSDLQQHLETLSERYVTEQGKNAYAVLNAITELASQPPESRYMRRDKHGLQRLAGEWVIAFKENCRQPSFSIDDYLERLAQDKPAASLTRKGAPYVSA